MTGESGRNARLARYFKLVGDLLRGREHDRHSVARLITVKPAMADRVINAAVKHLPGIATRLEGKRRLIKMQSAAAEPPPYAVAVAACFGASVWPLFRGSAYEKGIREALTHVTLRTRRRAVFKHIDRKFWFLSKGGEPALIDNSALLDELIEAVLQHKRVNVRYTRFEGHSEHLCLEPLSIAVHDHQLYLVARKGDNTLHPYRFCRIKTAEVLDDKFEYPSRGEYDPDQVFRDSFGVFLNLPVEDVEILLSRRWETYVRTHKWHGSQSFTVEEDGVHVKLHVRVCRELEAWILGFAEEAQVLGPPALQSRIEERIRAAAARLPAAKAVLVRS